MTESLKQTIQSGGQWKKKQKKNLWVSTFSGSFSYGCGDICHKVIQSQHEDEEAEDEDTLLGLLAGFTHNATVSVSEKVTDLTRPGVEWTDHWADGETDLDLV